MNPARLKKHLIQSGKISPQGIMKAEDYAMTAGVSLEEALVFLELMSPGELGEALSELYNLPYHPLLDFSPPDRLKKIVPLEVAEKWRVFPINFDESEDLLALAISDPEDTDRLMTLEGNILAPHRISYTVASEMEIRKAIDQFYKGKTVEEARDLELPEDFTIIPEEGQAEFRPSLEPVKPVSKRILLLDPELNRARSIRSLLENEGVKEVAWAASIKDVAMMLKKGSFDALLVNGNIFSQDGRWLQEINVEKDIPEVLYYSNFSPLLLGQAYPYRQLADALISTASFFVSWILKDQPRCLSEIRLCARYGKLLAMRLGLSEAKMDAVILASWLSVPELQHSIFEGVRTPYSLDEIINYGAALKGGKRRVEAIVYGIVKTYIDALRENPEISRELSRARDALVRKFPSPEDRPMVEAFLRLVKEDRFLKDIGRPSGTILILDPEATMDTAVTLRLLNEGYQVELTPSITRAKEILSSSRIDIIISETNVGDGDPLEFCRGLKTFPESSDALFMFLTSNNAPGLATKCLEVGADDFLQKPVDPDLLALKIARYLSRKGGGKAPRGVRGSLRDMQFTDIVQILCAGEKNVAIHFESGREKGSVYLQGGEVIHAATETHSGEEAFYELMGWTDANFQIVPCDTFPERSIDSSLMSLLMEGARLMDEASQGKDAEERARGEE